LNSKEKDQIKRSKREEMLRDRKETADISLSYLIKDAIQQKLHDDLKNK